MTSKQRAFLRSQGHVLPAMIQVGKEGESPALFQTFIEYLTHRELVKAHVLKSCPLTPREVAERVAQAIDAEVIQVIGRKFLLYKPNEELIKKGEALVLPRA